MNGITPILELLEQAVCQCGHNVMAHRRTHDEAEPPYPCTECDCEDYRPETTIA